VGLTEVVPVKATLPTSGSILILVASVTFQLRVALSPVVIVDGLAEKELTMGAVGGGTDISFVEVFANDDDGFEWFGGNVNSKYLVAAYCSDDQFDMDEGFSGSGQFWVALTDADSDNFGEHDGGPSSNRYGTPVSTPVQSNVTYIGPGKSANKRTLTLREYWGGSYHNSIFAEQGRGVRLDYVEEYEDGAKGGSFTLWNQGVLKLENNIFQNVASDDAASIFTVYSDQKTGDADKYPVPASRP